MGGANCYVSFRESMGVRVYLSSGGHVDRNHRIDDLNPQGAANRDGSDRIGSVDWFSIRVDEIHGGSFFT